MENKKYGKIKIKKVSPVLADIPEDCGYEKQFEHNIDMNSNGKFNKSDELIAKVKGMSTEDFDSALQSATYKNSDPIIGQSAEIPLL